MDLKQMKSKQKMKGDNLILFILIVMLITIALLVGVRQGYEKGVNLSNKYYSAYISNYCVCYEPLNLYETERFIPITILNLSTS